MKRKVIQIANSTQLVSLPRKWSQKYGVKKGDEIEVEEQGNKVVLSTDRGVNMVNVEIEPPHLKNITERMITSSYRNGTKEIKVMFDPKENPELFQYLNQKMDDQTVGFEMIKQEKDYFVIKDLSGPTEPTDVEFDSALRRSFLLVTAMAKDILTALNKKW